MDCQLILLSKIIITQTKPSWESPKRRAKRKSPSAKPSPVRERALGIKRSGSSAFQSSKLSPQTHRKHQESVHKKRRKAQLISRTIILSHYFLILLFSNLASANSFLIESPTSKLPAGANCQLRPAAHLTQTPKYDDGDDEPPATDQHNSSSLTDAIKLIKSPYHDSLRQLSQNTVQYKRVTTTSSGQPALPQDNGPRHQVAFESICSGWRNRIDPSSSQPLAYWVLDERIGALVAKFIYYKPEDFYDIAWREARLTSPIFQPIPAYHSMPDSRYYSTCKATFRSYLTITAHLELMFILVPTAASSGGGANGLGSGRPAPIQNNRAQGGQSFQLAKIMGSTLNGKSMQAVDSASELAFWTDHQVVLPRNLSQSALYQLEFAAMPGPLTSGASKSYKWLNGVAIANFSLAPQCFSLEVDEQELARVKSISQSSGNSALRNFDDLPVGGDEHGPGGTQTGAWAPYHQMLVNFFEAYKTSFLVAVILVLILLIMCSQWLLCAYHHQAAARRKQSKKAPSLCEKLVQYCFCCCWCCAEDTSTKRQHRVYAIGVDSVGAKHGLGPYGDDKFKLDDENRNNHLRPLQSIFENVELNENPNYMANGTTMPNSTITLKTQNWGHLPTSKSVTIPLEPYHIDRKRLTLMAALGKGAFGEVYQGYLVCYCSSDSGDGRLVKTNNGSQCSLDQLESHSIKVAVKTLTDDKMSTMDFIREAVNISLVKHRNIVELIGVCFDERPFYIIMELLEGGNLKNFLLKNRDKGHHYPSAPQPPPPALQLTPLQGGGSSLWSLNSGGGHPQSQAELAPPQSPLPPTKQDDRALRLCMGDLLVFALDIARACDYLQKKQFIHRDVAARNCLLTSSVKKVPSSCCNSVATSPLPLLDPRSEPSGSTLRSSRSFVGSLPTALEVDANHKVDVGQVFLSGYMNSGIVAKLADFGMTRDIYSQEYYRMANKEMPVRWMPPECLDGVATTQSDVWSFGVFLWELFSVGQLPYQDLLDNVRVIEFLRQRRTARPKAQRPQQQQQQLQPDNSLNLNLDNNINSGSINSNENDRLLLTPAQFNDLQPPRASPPSSSRVPPPPPPPNNNNDHLLIEADENEMADLPPLPPPHEDTPHSIYSIMCSCWATNPEERPQFEEIANRIYWCLQMPEVLNTSLPCFYEPHTPSGQQQQTLSYHQRSESRSGLTQTTQLNWWCP